MTTLDHPPTSAPDAPAYPARLEVDRPERHDRLTALVRLVLLVPVVVLHEVLTGGLSGTGGGGVLGGLVVATALMIVVRRRYPRWWFDAALELTRFATRICAYATLLTDRYPSTEDEQAVHLDLDYPDVRRDLHRWLPLVKWLLVLPHLLVLVVLTAAAGLAVVAAWVAILVTGRYPRPLFDLVVGVGRWWLRVQAYALLLVTDRYPPFSLRA